VQPMGNAPNMPMHTDLRESGRVDESGIAIRSGWCDNLGDTARRRVMGLALDDSISA
jgi:hypothetical protein